MKISVLVAARNEENNIEKCLNALYLAINQTSHRVEVLVGNDESTDQTLAKIENFIANLSTKQNHFHIFNIKKSNLQGKANVLAQLAQNAQGEFLFITDADIEVPPTWFDAMLIFEKYDLITGVSEPTGNNFLSEMQGFEWLFVLYILHLLSLKNIGLTTMGNNMAIKRAIYEKIGGYEKIPFSVTEDFALFHVVKNSGGRFINAFSADILAKTPAIPGANEWFRQRKRWLRGAWKGGFVAILGSFVFSFLEWIILFSTLLFSPYFLLLFMVYYFFLVFGAKKVNDKLAQKKLKTKHIIWYPFYHAFYYPLLLLLATFSRKVNWKGRNF